MQALYPGLLDRGGNGRGRCLKANAKHHDFALWFLAGDLQGIERRVQHTYIATFRTRPLQ